jgi:addiction module RelE/StbE family toxin
MNSVRFSEFALRDLQDIADYIEQDNEKLASEVISSLEEFCLMLGIMPELGRPSEIAGVRKLITPRYHYKIIYEIHSRKKETVILRVYHHTRKIVY